MDIDRRGLLKAVGSCRPPHPGRAQRCTANSRTFLSVSELDGHQHLARRISLPLGPDRHDTVHAEFVAPRCRRSLLGR